MKDWIETTNPPGIWVWGSEGGGWKWHPPPVVDPETATGETLDRKIDDFMRGVNGGV